MRLGIGKVVEDVAESGKACIGCTKDPGRDDRQVGFITENW